MNLRSSRVLLSFLVLPIPSAFATETDQFTTPKTRLQDIGPAISRRVVEIIETHRTGGTPEQILSKYIGSSIFSSRLTHWAREIQSGDGRVTFRPSILASVYRTAAAPVPTAFWFNAPTVNVHGYYMGTDKIDHFFRQGHDYAQTVLRKQAEGAGLAEAIRAAVSHGVKQERSYFGTLISGVYSNADLAANYAGMKFYLNLRRPVMVGGRLLPPMFEPSAGGWRLRPGVNPDRLIEPFLSDHLDESLNPNRYSLSRGSIRKRIRRRCATWTMFYADRLSLVARAGESFARTWFGENYGHWLPEGDEVSIATECELEGLSRRD